MLVGSVVLGCVVSGLCRSRVVLVLGGVGSELCWFWILPSRVVLVLGWLILSCIGLGCVDPSV